VATTALPVAVDGFGRLSRRGVTERRYARFPDGAGRVEWTCTGSLVSTPPVTCTCTCTGTGALSAEVHSRTYSTVLLYFVLISVQAAYQVSGVAG
jgi:hypothetical protein